MGNEFTITGCVDCGEVRVLSRDEPQESAVAYLYGGSAVRMWHYGKHQLILVKTKPERMFLSCQPFDKLFSEHGIASILSFVEGITKDQEASNEPIA